MILVLFLRADVFFESQTDTESSSTESRVAESLLLAKYLYIFKHSRKLLLEYRITHDRLQI